LKKTTIFIIIISSIIILSIFLIKVFPILQPKSKPVGLLPLLNEEESKAKEVSEEIPFLKNVEIILVDKNNRCNWKLFVEIVEEKEEIRLLSRIKGEYYTLSGDKYLVEAAKGQLDEDFTSLNLSEEVTLLGPDLNLYAKELSWDSQRADEIVGKSLNIDYGGLTVKAEEFSLKPDDSELEIPGHSRSTFR
jgi:hypothetical protein